MITLSLEVEGLEVIHREMCIERAQGAKGVAIELLSHPREDAGVTNAQLLKWHAEGKGKLPKRDAVTPTQAETNEIAQAYLDEKVKEIAKQFKRAKRYQKQAARAVGGIITSRTGKQRKLAPPPNVKQLANQRLKKCGTAAMKRWMEISMQHIEEGRGAFGPIPQIDPDSAYGKKKLTDHHFVNPALQASGQITDLAGLIIYTDRRPVKTFLKLFVPPKTACIGDCSHARYCLHIYFMHKLSYHCFFHRYGTIRNS